MILGLSNPKKNSNRFERDSKLKILKRLEKLRRREKSSNLLSK